MADKKTTAEAAVLEVPAEYPNKETGTDPQSNLPTVKVSQGDMPDPDPLHAGPGRVGAHPGVFDPNAALRNKLGRGPGLQDSEAKNPAVWVDLDNEEGRKRSADAHVQDAERQLEAAKKRAAAIKKGAPLDREVR